jgi:hypothetical protein
VDARHVAPSRERRGAFDRGNRRSPLVGEHLDVGEAGGLVDADVGRAPSRRDPDLPGGVDVAGIGAAPSRSPGARPRFGPIRRTS